MNIIIIIVLAIIQGATEFLPISSSGHLVLAYHIFGIEDATILLSVILHLATLLSVIVYYRRDIWELIRHPLCPTNTSLVISTIITCIMAVILKPSIENAFGGEWLWLGFVITAIILILAQFLGKKSSPSADITNLHINPWRAAVIGFAQGIACFPAISRSGSTIASGVVVGCNRDDVTKYSFLLSIPIIIASTLLEVIEYTQGSMALAFNAIELIIGFIIAFLVGIAAIHIMTKIVRKQKLYYFSFYLLLLAIVTKLLI